MDIFFLVTHQSNEIRIENDSKENLFNQKHHQYIFLNHFTQQQQKKHIGTNFQFIFGESMIIEWNQMRLY